MAKIQEAKELPKVRTLDQAVQEEKKSGPSRILIVALSLLCALAMACAFVLGKDAWQQMPPDHPRRLLANEIRKDVKSLISRTAHRG
jgi:hypothetical protein